MKPIWPTDTYSNKSTSFSFPSSSRSFHPKERFERQQRGMCLWNMLTQANKKAGKAGGEIQRDTHKETKTLWTKYSSCSSSFPLKSGKSWCTPLSWGMCGHMITRPRYSEVYGSLQLPGLWKEKTFLSAIFPNMLHKPKSYSLHA